MQQFVRTLSHLLEIDRPRLNQDDHLDLGDEGRNQLAALKVLVPTRNARHVVCDACHNDHVEEVIRTKSPGGEVAFHIRCNDAGWVLVPEQRLRQWTIDVQRVVTLLSEGIGAGQAQEEWGDKSIWRLGQVRIAGEQFAIVLVRECFASDDALLERVSARTPRARTILIGTGDLHDATGFAAITSIPSAFAFVDGRFAIQIDQIRPVMNVETCMHGNVFRLLGDYWHVAFDGQTVHLKDSVGFCYLARLLTEPQRDIPAVSLLAARAGIDPRMASGSDGELLDDAGRAKFKQRYQELIEELDEAQKNNDIGRITQAKAEMESLGNELSRATGLGGRSREKTDADKVRKAVSMAVSRDIERITLKHPALGRHLEKSITSGYTFRYDPEKPVDWLV